MSFTDADLTSAIEKIAAADFSEAEIDAIAHALGNRDDTTGFAADPTMQRVQVFLDRLGDRLVVPPRPLSGTDLGSGR
jgi:hypothetical protein